MRARLVIASVALLAGLVPAIPNAPARAREAPHVFVYSQTLDYRHPSINRAKEVLRELAVQHGFTVELSEDPLALNPVTLARTDVWVWLNNTGAPERGSPFTDAQEALYERWMTCGGGHVGVHAALSAYGDEAFPPYVEANGALLAGHPPGEPPVTVLVADSLSPMTAPWRGKTSFRYVEELYRVDRDPARIVHDFRMLLASGSGNGVPFRAPLAWAGSYRGHNRTIYTNLGHRAATWDDPAFQQHLVAGITWVGRQPADSTCLAATAFRHELESPWMASGGAAGLGQSVSEFYRAGPSTSPTGCESEYASCPVQVATRIPPTTS